MRKMLGVALTGLATVACSETPTSGRTPVALVSGEPAFVRGPAQGPGAEFFSVGETGVDAPLPGGFCTFRPDGVGEFNNFLRTDPDGTPFLKIQDASGTVTITPVGEARWSGHGRVTVNWPGYPAGQSFEMVMTGDPDGEGPGAICKDKIANGVRVESFVRVK